MKYLNNKSLFVLTDLDMPTNFHCGLFANSPDKICNSTNIMLY